MSYSKHIWNANELVTSDKLNYMEDGIAGLSYTVTIAETDWVSASNTFTYFYTAIDLTSTDEINYVVNSGEENILSAITVTGGTDSLTFSTAVKPAGSVTITIFTI